MLSFKEFLSETYKGEHEAPDKTSGSPMHDLRGTYPDDFYSFDGARHYANEGQPYDGYVHTKISSARFRPEKHIRVYRAVPDNVKGKSIINKGDWVTLHKSYAHQHGKAELNGKYRVTEKVVKARDLFTDGNSVHEWGYDPQPHDMNTEKHYKQLRLSLKK